MVRREEGRRPGRFRACSGTEPPESTRREDLLQVQQWPRTRAEQLLRLLDVVVGTDTAADVEKRDASFPEAFGSLDEQRRRGIAALGQRDVEENVRGATRPTEQRHGDERIVTERAEKLHLVARRQRLPRRLRKEVVRSCSDPLKELVGGLEYETKQHVAIRTKPARDAPAPELSASHMREPSVKSIRIVDSKPVEVLARFEGVLSPEAVRAENRILADIRANPLLARGEGTPLLVESRTMASAGEPRESERRRNVGLPEEAPLDQRADDASLGAFGEVQIRRQMGRQREGVAVVPRVTEAVGDAGESRAPTVAFVEPDQAMAYVPDASPRTRFDQAVTCHYVTDGRNRGSSAAAALIARTRKVTFLVPASATPGFLSQIAALQLALRRLPWTRWQADIVVCFGGRPGLEATFQLSRWLPYLADVTMVFPRERATDGDYDGQIDELYRAAPADADVLVRADADVLPVANLEPLLDFVLERSAIAGVTAHYRFPAPPGVGNREAWDAVSEGFLDEPLRFEHSYSLVTPDVSQEEQVCPFYLNDGFVVFAREYFDRFAPLYLDTRPHVADRLVDPYYAGQIALALSAARIPLPSIALPLRFNLPNDPVVTERYPEELENAVVFHYLREDQFDRQQIFRWRETYSVFLARPLNPANARLRDSVRTLFGEEYPFDHPPEPQDRPEAHGTRPSARRADETAASVSLTAEQALLGGSARPARSSR